jgi:hypothetical protein
MLADAGQIDQAVDGPEKMVRWHVPLRAEAVEQLLLHHPSVRPALTQSPLTKKIESVLQNSFNPDFFNTIGGFLPYVSSTGTSKVRH